MHFVSASTHHVNVMLSPAFKCHFPPQVCHSKVEELSLPPGTQVDVLVSEPMGTLLVNERMLETYLYARDKFLKPGGKMFPVRDKWLVLCNANRRSCCHINAATGPHPRRIRCLQWMRCCTAS